MTEEKRHKMSQLQSSANHLRRLETILAQVRPIDWILLPNSTAFKVSSAFAVQAAEDLLNSNLFTPINKENK